MYKTVLIEGITIGNVTDKIDKQIAEMEKLHTTVDPQALWKAYGMQEPDLKRNILRGEMAVMIDQVLDPFNKKQIDITGKYIQ